jgi:hypothetical protein
MFGQEIFVQTARFFRKAIAGSRKLRPFRGNSRMRPWLSRLRAITRCPSAIFCYDLTPLEAWVLNKIQAALSNL